MYLDSCPFRMPLHGSANRRMLIVLKAAGDVMTVTVTRLQLTVPPVVLARSLAAGDEGSRRGRRWADPFVPHLHSIHR